MVIDLREEVKSTTLAQFIEQNKEPDGSYNLPRILRQLQSMLCGHFSASGHKRRLSLNWRDISLKNLTLDQLRELMSSGKTTITIWFFFKETIKNDFCVYRKPHFYC